MQPSSMEAAQPTTTGHEACALSESLIMAQAAMVVKNRALGEQSNTPAARVPEHASGMCQAWLLVE